MFNNSRATVAFVMMVNRVALPTKASLMTPLLVERTM